MNRVLNAWKISGEDQLIADAEVTLKLYEILFSEIPV